jgi:hypothetical protein
MEAQQKFTNEISVIDGIMQKRQEAIIAEATTDPRWETLIDYRALNGTIIYYDENSQTESIRKMPMEELATALGVTRQSLYDWEKLIPNFWERVRERKQELSSQKRLSLMEDKFFLNAMKWKNPIISIEWMKQHNPNWKDPRFKVEHELGTGFADLIAAHRNRQIQERKIIDVTPDQS